MTLEEFGRLVAEEFPKAIEEKFHGKIKNVAFLVEDEPSLSLRHEEGLGPHETLLGHYRGIPHLVRGDSYGIGATLPDTITLFRIPLEMEAMQWGGGEESLRRAVRETIWHEVAHYFGMDEREVRSREEKRHR
jgi:predicted Zn-dependent protease with MMP-like domain